MSDRLFTRDEVMGGLPSGRARTLLFLLETRTARQVANARQEMERFLTEDAVQERNLAFLEAFTLGREPPLRPTIQSLERFAPSWEDLIPSNPRLQAALAKALGEKYRFRWGDVPTIRRLLQLDDDAVQHTYARLYERPLGSIYAENLPPSERLRWVTARTSRRLETLPPFWTAFSLTLTETVGAGLVALPIGIAHLGLLPGLILLVFFGLINMITIASISEAVARNGSVRYGDTFIGRVVAEYLGTFASSVTSGILALLTMLLLVVYYVGASTTLEHTVHLPAVLGTAAVFAFNIVLITRKSLNATITSALIVGGVNLCLILVMALLAIPHLQWANLSYVHVPFYRGVSFEPSVFATIFGIILAAYFGHLSMGNCAHVVLRRDPTGKSFMIGGIAAQSAAMGIYCIWIFCLIGSIGRQSLTGQHSTVLVPLAQLAGPFVVLLGSIYVLLAMGMGSVHYAMAIRNLVLERLPRRSGLVMSLWRSSGTLAFRPFQPLFGRTGGAVDEINLSYIGLRRGAPIFRLVLRHDGRLREMEMPIQSMWSLEAVADAPQRVHLSVEVLQASDDAVSVRVHSSMRLGYQGDWLVTGVGTMDILELPDSQRELAQWILRQGEVSMRDVVVHLNQSDTACRALLEQMAERGMVQVIEDGSEPHFRVHLARKRGSALPDHLWEAIGVGPPEHAADSRRPSRNTMGESVMHFVSSERARALLSLLPVVSIFLFTESLLLGGTATFAGPFNLVGVTAVSVLGGTFPALLMASGRRKGEYVPGLVFRSLGRWPIVIGVYLLFLANMLVHGFIIWNQPVERLAAIGIGVLVIVMTISTVRHGAFTRRMVLEVRENAGTGVSFRCVANGRSAIAKVQYIDDAGEQELATASGKLPPLSSLRRAAFTFPANDCRELKIWTHRVTREGTSEPLEMRASIDGGGETIDMQLYRGQLIVPLDGATRTVTLTPERTASHLTP